ncbi:MAG: hypothetical protein WAZ34_10595 [Rhodocyclaceae bacterium]
MEVLVIPVFVICTLLAIWFLLKLTVSVSVNDPGFAAKAFVSGLASSAVGYLAEGHVVIKVALWGVGGFVLYVAYKFVFDHR